jgi:hypothetical protein
MKEVLPLLEECGKWLNSHSFLLDTDMQAWGFLRGGCSLLSINRTKRQPEKKINYGRA